MSHLWLHTLGSPMLTCDPSPGCSFLFTTTPCTQKKTSTTPARETFNAQRPVGTDEATQLTSR